jgi:hypothetical protein
LIYFLFFFWFIFEKELQPSHFAASIIQKMIEHLPKDRIPLSVVKKLLKGVSTDERDGPSDNGAISGFTNNFSDHPSSLPRATVEAYGVRCANFHPIDSAIVACGLCNGTVMLFKGSHPSLPIEKWNASKLDVGGFVTCIKWNVSIHTQTFLLSNG